MPSGDFSTTYTFPNAESNGAVKTFDTTGVVGESSLLPGTSIARGYQALVTTPDGEVVFFSGVGSIVQGNLGAAWPGDSTDIQSITVVSNGDFNVNIGIAGSRGVFFLQMTESEFAEAENLWCVFQNAGRAYKFRFGDGQSAARYPYFSFNQGNIPYPAVGSAFRFALYTNEPFPVVATTGSAITLPLVRSMLNVTLSDPGETGMSALIPFPNVRAGLVIDDPSALSFPSVDAIQQATVTYNRSFARAVSSTSQEEVYYDYGSNRFTLNLQLVYKTEADYRDFKAILDAEGPTAVFSLPVGSITGGFPNTGSLGRDIRLTQPAPAGTTLLRVNAEDVLGRLPNGNISRFAPKVVSPGHVIQSADHGKTYAVQRVEGNDRIHLSWPIIQDLGTGSIFRSGRNAGMVVRLTNSSQPTTRDVGNSVIVTTSLSLIEAV